MDLIVNKSQFSKHYPKYIREIESIETFDYNYVTEQINETMETMVREGIKTRAALEFVQTVVYPFQDKNTVKQECLHHVHRYQNKFSGSYVASRNKRQFVWRESVE